MVQILMDEAQPVVAVLEAGPELERLAGDTAAALAERARAGDDPGPGAWPRRGAGQGGSRRAMPQRPAPDGVARGNGAVHAAFHAGTRDRRHGRRIRPGRTRGVRGRPGARLRALGLRRLPALPAGNGEPLRDSGRRPGRPRRRGRPRWRPGRVHGGAVGTVPGPDPGSGSRGRPSVTSASSRWMFGRTPGGWRWKRARTRPWPTPASYARRRGGEGPRWCLTAWPRTAR